MLVMTRQGILLLYATIHRGYNVLTITNTPAFNPVSGRGVKYRYVQRVGSTRLWRVQFETRLVQVADERMLAAFFLLYRAHGVGTLDTHWRRGYLALECESSLIPDRERTG